MSEHVDVRVGSNSVLFDEELDVLYLSSVMHSLCVACHSLANKHLCVCRPFALGHGDKFSTRSAAQVCKRSKGCGEDCECITSS